MDLAEKLEILADSAKYDVACTSSGVDRAGQHGSLGSCVAPGICHSFTPDGRCVSLLKVLYSNVCSYDCSYCVNRRSNDIRRATFTPRELAELTIGFYRRNYIEGGGISFPRVYPRKGHTRSGPAAGAPPGAFGGPYVGEY